MTDKTKKIQLDYVACLYFKRELLFFRQAYDNPSNSIFEFYIKLKSHLISLKNFKDFIKEKSVLFKDRAELNAQKKGLNQLLNCAEYLRNKICGHVNSFFIEQAVTWSPEILSNVEGNVPQEQVEQYRTELFIKSLIESGINSYRIDFNDNTIFPSEIDLLYPPDLEKLMTFIRNVNEKSIQLLDQLIALTKNDVHFFDGIEEQLKAISVAAKMDFGTRNRNT